MCSDAADIEPWQLKDFPNHFKTQKMSDNVVLKDSYSLQFVPDWLVTWQQMKIWADDDDCYHDDEPIEWFKKYRKRKAQKASIKEELLPTTWYLDRVKDWCISEDE